MRCGTADAEHVGERGEEVDGGGERVDDRRGAPGQRMSSGMWPSGSYTGTARLAPDVLLAEVVAVVGADDHRGVVPAAGGSRAASSIRPNQWSIIESFAP